MVTSPKEIKINILDMIIPLTRRKKTVALITFFFVAFAVINAYITEPEYSATAVVMPKEDNTDILSSYFKNIPMAKSQLKGNMFSPATDIENVYIGILKSRKLQLQVIEKFNLAKVYKFKKVYFIEDVLKAFSKHVSCIVSDEGLLSIVITDGSPTRAAEMANYMVGLMDEIYMNLSAETARNQRMFLEDRLKIIKRDLLNCEDSLAAFQIANGIVDIDQQAKATVEAAATIEFRLLTAELDLNIAKRIFLTDNQKVKEMEISVAELKKQRDNLSAIRENDFLIPLRTAPDIGVRFFRLKRSLKIQELLFELVMQQYETAKLEEAKNTPHVQILDKADPPQKRTKPKRKKMVMGWFFASVVFNLILVNFLEVYKRMRKENSENYQKIATIWKNMWR